MWRYILLFFFGYIIIKGYVRYRTFKKMILNQQDQFRKASEEQHIKEEGEINVISREKKDNDDDSSGDYVDFEEL